MLSKGEEYDSGAHISLRHIDVCLVYLLALSHRDLRGIFVSSIRALSETGPWHILL